MISTPVELALHRDDLIERAIEQLTSDTRTIAAWLGGSLGRGEEDAWSDVDLLVLVEDDQFDAFWSDRQALFDSIGSQILQQQPMPQNSIIPGGNFQLVIFSGPVEIDWTIAPVSNAQRAIDTMLLFERRPIPTVETPIVGGDDAFFRDKLEFFWAMAPVAVKYAARDDMLAAAGMISMLRESLSAIDERSTRPSLSRLNRQIALIEIQQLCSEAAVVGDDRAYIGIAGEIDHLIMLAAE